ncbi:MAG TPA: carbamoyltransferase [Xanthobacteraceae bacterium]|nr:carbamoyltransferase [Xanthobacteraceae bacterium]
MRVLGISAFYHDSAAALVVDGRIVAAAQEERFTRIKQDAGFPRQAIEYCLAAGGTGLADVDYVVFYEKPFLKFERLLETYVGFAPRGLASFATAMPVWIRDKLFQKDAIARELKTLDPGFDAAKRMRFTEHHLSHAASAFFPSPFDSAVVLTMDGVGEWPTTTVALGDGNKLEIVKELHFPHSLGLLYSAFTYYLGFKVNSGEYKLMGLAPYGEPKFKDRIIGNLMDLKPDGTFRLDMSYFNYCTGLTMTNRKFADLFGEPVREPDKALLTQFHMDLAASIQAVTEEIILRLGRSLAREYRRPNLCLAGGVALNCVANGKLLRDGCFEHIWVQPAAGDAGGALGAALAAWHLMLGNPRSTDGRHDTMAGALLGPEFSQSDIERRLQAAGARFSVASDTDLIAQTAAALAQGEAVGWMQGRMEYGPRSLGARSILADPRSPQMQKQLNLKIKYRESFRPFAPAVLRDKAHDWFEFEGDSPYMLFVAGVQPSRRRAMKPAEQALFGIDKLNVVRSDIPAVTHVDYSARLQTVDAHTNPRFHALLDRFHALTGCPILVNTSFNVRSEPIVCTPEDAFRCFMGTEIDLLVVGNCALRKKDQDPSLARDYRDEFEPD